MSLLSLSKKRRNRESINDSTQNEEPALKRLNISSLQCSPLMSVSQRNQDDRRCGKILKIRLINFMCHSNLLIEFHPRVNFLVGNNGSGKSAIVAALVLGLGGNAKTTSRSRSVKEFIKVGETSAKIEITIANDGPQSFESTTYGDHIKIVRNISATSGNYTIKSAWGSTISKKFDDLQRILLYHNVQVDNPVFILNQDFAREFLKDLQPSKNYKLFLKATQIDLVTEKLTECLHLHNAHKEELNNAQKKLDQLDNEIKQHKDNLQECIAFGKLKHLLNSFEVEHSWLQVKAYEDKLKELNDTLQQHNNERGELENMFSNRDEIHTQITQSIQEQDIIITNKNQQYSKTNGELRQIKSQLNECCTLSTDYLSNQDVLNKRKKRLQKQIIELEEHIEQRLLKNESCSIREQNEAKLLEYRRLCDDNLTPIIKTLEHDLDNFMENKCQKQLILDTIVQKQRQHSDKLRLLKSEIQNLKASTKEKMFIYGEYMPRLLDEIKKAHNRGEFAKMPIGPIGSYIEVPNNKCRNMVETVIGHGILKAFLVENTKDRNTLEKIIKQLSCPRPIIITTLFMNHIYNVENGKVLAPSGTSLLMDKIKCTHPMVMNYLIDHSQVETILVTESKKIAEQITSNRNSVPVNLSKVIVFNDESKHGLEYHPVPTYRMYSIKVQNAKFIQVTINEHIKRLEIDMNTIENELRKLGMDKEQIVQQLTKDKACIAEKRSKLERMQNEFSDLRLKITELENFEYSDYNSEIALLRKEIEGNTTALADIEKDLSNLKAKYAECDVKKRLLEEQLAHKQNTLQIIQGEIENLKSKMDQFRIKLRSENDKGTRQRSELQQLKIKEDQILKSINEVTGALNVTRLDAIDKGPRPNVLSMSTDEIRIKIAKTKAQLKRGKPTNLDEDSLKKLIASKEHARETNAILYDNLEATIRTLRQSLRHRFEFLRKYKRHMSILIQMHFGVILKFRDFSGELVFDHQENTLNVSITPRNHIQNGVSSTRALSGGERSYSTIALLLALWAVADHPFYALDEYDVFTDEVNREYMKRLLIDEGREKPLRQYLFLTPQDMSLIKQDFIKIHKLAEPESH